MPDPVEITDPILGSPRSTKRERTRAKLLANAVALFRAKGVRETKLAEIAQASEVAPATLFNHFPSRADLAAGWLRGEIEAEATRAASAVREGERGLRASVRSLCRNLARQSSDAPGIRWSAWQEAPRLRPDPVAGLRDAFALEQQREHVRADQTPEALAELLADAIEGGLVEGLHAAIETEESDPRARARLISAPLQARVDLVLDGARKRNERVRPGALAASRAEG